MRRAKLAHRPGGSQAAVDTEKAPCGFKLHVLWTESEGDCVLETMALEKVQKSMSSVRVPGPRDRVFKDECMFSFDTAESPGGLFTSLTSWQSFGADYVAGDFERNGNALYLKQVWRRIKKEPVDDAEAKESAPTKLAIGMDGGFDVNKTDYDVEKSAFVVAMPDIDAVIPVDDATLPMIVGQAATAILQHEGATRADALAAAWEEEDRKESKYAADLPQLDNGKKISPDPSSWKCEDSGKTENLWLNLSTGYIGSGRRNFDGTGGTGAALKHYEDTGRQYPLAVKLGTITPHGADVFSYAPDENDMVLDPKLAEHLAHWGINMQAQEKTEKTMAELQIDLNSTYEFDKLTESGADLQKMCGPGYIGLENLGNSCYMSSVMQLMFAIPAIAERYYGNADRIVATAPQDPSEDLISMTGKLAVGLLSERYTQPVKTITREEADAVMSDAQANADAPKTAPYEPSSVRPTAFKAVIGKGHPEFSTSRQQDASEFFQHLLECWSRAERTGASRLSPGSPEGAFEPTASLFQFQFEDRTECQQSGKVRYVARSDNLMALSIPVDAATNQDQVREYEEHRQKKQKTDSSEEEPVIPHVPFKACLDALAAPETITEFMSPATGTRGVALKQTRVKTFPDYLVVVLRRYYLADDWTPKKLIASVPVPETLDLEHLRARGLQAGEEELPDAPTETAETDTSATGPAAIVPDPAIVAQVVSMGFSENGAKRAAVATQNAGADACMEWVFAHMEDADFNDPLPEATPSGSAGAPQAAEPSAEAVGTLSAMGFTADQAKAALKATGGSLERAADWLFSHADDLDAAIAEEENKGASAGDSTATSPMRDGKGVYDMVGFASHMGSNTACGHYVAHIKKDGKFVLYNDEKVAVSQRPPLESGFLYLFKRRE